MFMNLYNLEVIDKDAFMHSMLKVTRQGEVRDMESEFCYCIVEGGLNLLHEADDDAVIWLEATATAALAK